MSPEGEPEVGVRPGGAVPDEAVPSSPGRRRHDRDAARLHRAVRVACGREDGFPGRLEAGLRAALAFLAAEPQTAHLLTVDPYMGDGEEALDTHREWIGRFGELLRDAALADPRASREPPFLAPFLIGGVRFQVARLVLKGEGSDLLRLLPGTLEALLAYYYEPGEPRRLAGAALAGRGRPA